MNYYNPYFSMMPYTSIPARTGLFSRLFGGNISFGSILSGTQKVIGFANQAIPLVKQVGPVINNAKTMFRVMNEFKKVEAKETSSKVEKVEENPVNDNVVNYNDGPTFFI